MQPYGGGGSNCCGKKAPLRPGEKVQLRLAGASPVMVSDSGQLAIVLDPSGCNAASSLSGSNSSALVLRHGDRQVMALVDVGDGDGSALTVGGLHAPSSYLSVCTTDATSGSSNGSSSNGSSSNGSIAPRQKERLRVGPGNVVSLPPDGFLAVGGSASIGKDVLVRGMLYASRYDNLVDNWTSPSMTQPPTANALAGAFAALSNLLMMRTGGLAWSHEVWSSNATWSSNAAAWSSNATWSSNLVTDSKTGVLSWTPSNVVAWSPSNVVSWTPSNVVCWSSNASSNPVAPGSSSGLARCASMDSLDSWTTTASSGSTDAMTTGAIACASLRVDRGGCVNAYSFCNLIDDYRVSDYALPPTANALNAAYVQLSNFVVSQLTRAGYAPLVSVLAIAGASGTAVSGTSEPVVEVM